MKRTKKWLLAALVVGVGLSSIGGTGHAATTDPQGFITQLKSPVVSVANQ